MSLPLDDVVVVDVSSGVAGGYCTRLLADGGADVIKLEAQQGDPLRTWSISGNRCGDGALFNFLSGGKRSVVVDPARESSRESATSLVTNADIVVWSPGSGVADHPAFSPEALRRIAPHATVLAITPFGLTGPWVGRPCTEFTLQAWSGGIAGRGDPARPPVSAGGRTGDWLTGMIGAVASLSGRWRSLATGTGELIDLSMLESIVLTHTMYPVTYQSISGQPSVPQRIKNFPGIERAKDGFVAFMVVTGQQWLDFCAMVDRPDWLQDESLMYLGHRLAQRETMAAALDPWMTQRTVDEIVELASLYRIPVAPVGNGATVATFDHFIAGGYIAKYPDGSFVHPTPPYRFHHSAIGNAAPRRAPRLGEHTGMSIFPRTAPKPGASAGGELPFAGLRIADFTAFWAGPIVGHVMAMLGADVIHIESTQRPDGMRFRGAKPFDTPNWWETGPSYHGGNTNKRGLTLDMASERGRELAFDLIKTCDVVIENYTPRVTEGWGLTYDNVKRVKPDVIMLRMPGFGTSGPWRDRSGYAQNMEAVAGLAWLTGYPDEEPQVLNGPGDPIAGTHATFALLLALEHRRRTGEGCLIESPMVGGALAIAAEQLIEYSAYGNLLERTGNRAPTAAPQNLYLSADVNATGARDSWVAIAVETGEQWAALAHTIGRPEWSTDATLATIEGRRAAQDTLDREIADWASARSAMDIVDVLWTAGVPAGRVIKAEEQVDNEQLQHRRFFEDVEHPILGSVVHCGYPARFSAGPVVVNRSHAPMLGQHNREILTELCGSTDDQIASLEADGIIGTEVRM